MFFNEMYALFIMGQPRAITAFHLWDEFGRKDSDGRTKQAKKNWLLE